MKRDLLTILDLKKEEILQLIKLAQDFKKKAKRQKVILKGKTLAMIFEKHSTRTRVSFEVAMVQLGGHPLVIDSQSSQLSRGESIADTAQVLSRYVDGIMFRANRHQDIVEMAQHATVPVINGLSDLYHPAQVLSDLLTLAENFKDIKKLSVCYLGDWNNLTRSWINAAIRLGFVLKIACPQLTWPSENDRRVLKNYSNIKVMLDAQAAVSGSNVLYTDAWVSMGQAEHPSKEQFYPYQINAALLKNTAPQAIVLHCLPAHRGEEITDEVMDGPASRVFDQAENRLHMQKAILKMLLK